MTHPNIGTEPDPQPHVARRNFEALADQLIDDAWHLPPEGDQSWREADARRIFRGDGKRDINDESRDEEHAPQGEKKARRAPVFQPPRAAGVVLPLALATFMVLVIMVVSAPEVLTTRFWAASEPATVTPARIASAAPVQPMAAPRDLRPSLARQDRAGAALAIAMRNEALGTVGHAKAGARKKASTPIGAVPAHFARSPYKRATAQAAAVLDTTAPAADEASSSTALDWKTEAAKWDRMASIIRARREKHLKAEDSDADESSDASQNTFP